MKKTLLIIVAVAVLGFLGLDSRAKSSGGSGSTLPTGTTAPSPTSTVSANNTSPSIRYKDGSFTGSTTETPYGPVQIGATIRDGKITDISFLQMPSEEGHSREVTAFSEPLLKQSALTAQTAHIDFVSGATSTSEGFEQSLQAALDQAAV